MTGGSLFRRPNTHAELLFLHSTARWQYYENYNHLPETSNFFDFPNQWFMVHLFLKLISFIEAIMVSNNTYNQLVF